MDGRVKVQRFEQIRLGHATEKTILGLAEKYGIHRVRQAISSAIPPERKKECPERAREAERSSITRE